GGPDGDQRRRRPLTRDSAQAAGPPHPTANPKPTPLPRPGTVSAGGAACRPRPGRGGLSGAAGPPPASPPFPPGPAARLPAPRPRRSARPTSRPEAWAAQPHHHSLGSGLAAQRLADRPLSRWHWTAHHDRIGPRCGPAPNDPPPHRASRVRRAAEYGIPLGT